MVGKFEGSDLDLMVFYMQDLTFWVRFKEAHEDNQKLRETAREFIIYNEWSIQKIKEMIDEDRKRPRKTG